MGFILLLIALFLSYILLPLGWIYSFLTFRFKWRNGSNYAKKIAISLDQLGNVVLATFMNDFFIKNEGHKFGDEDETISLVLGINKQNKTLSKLGIKITEILNNIDKDHVEKAVIKNNNKLNQTP